MGLFKSKPKATVLVNIRNTDTGSVITGCVLDSTTQPKEGVESVVYNVDGRKRKIFLKTARGGYVFSLVIPDGAPMPDSRTRIKITKVALLNTV